MDLQPEDDVRTLLQKLAADPRIGRVTVRMRGNAHLTGTIGPIGSQSVVIKALSGREYYDAWVRLESITSIEVQTRS